jgi:hypothetical protein
VIEPLFPKWYSECCRISEEETFMWVMPTNKRNHNLTWMSSNFQWYMEGFLLFCLVFLFSIWYVNWFVKKFNKKFNNLTFEWLKNFKSPKKIPKMDQKLGNWNWFSFTSIKKPGKKPNHRKKKFLGLIKK